MNLENKNGVTGDPNVDRLKTDVRTASYEQLYDEWSKQETTRWYNPDGVMYKIINRYFEQKK